METRGGDGIKKRVFCLLVLLSLLLSLFSCSNENDTRALEIYFLDVGQGDAILLRTEEGDILIDAGTEASQEMLCYRLSSLGVESLMLAIFTHSDEDHIGGADGVLRSIPTKTVWISRHFEENEAVEMLLSAARETKAQVIKVGAGMEYSLGALSLKLLSPFDSMAGLSSNEKSLVVRAVCGDVCALFMGDASQAVETELLARYPASLVSCDLLKVAHHGSESSSSQAFLDVAKPKYAVISCGAGNSYGHPHGMVLDRLAEIDSEILRTDLEGDILFWTDGERLQRENK